MGRLAEALESTQPGGEHADSGTDGAEEIDWSLVPRYATVQCVPVGQNPSPKPFPWGQPMVCSLA